MHTQPMADSDGDFSAPQPTETHCRLCEERSVTVQVWESHCGAYEDYKYTCQVCKHHWWIEGADA
jgi:hypothetical protein